MHPVLVLQPLDLLLHLLHHQEVVHLQGCQHRYYEVEYCLHPHVHRVVLRLLLVLGLQHRLVSEGQVKIGQTQQDRTYY